MAEPHSERQLLAIMFTDVVGYTALTERDEAAAVRVRDAHRELVHTLVKQFDGEVATGDLLDDGSATASLEAPEEERLQSAATTQLAPGRVRGVDTEMRRAIL